MFDELSRGIFFITCATIATGSWLGGAYSIYRGARSLPEGKADVPFFSADPNQITDEGRIWRRRIYACMAYFAMSIAVVLLIYRGH